MVALNEVVASNKRIASTFPDGLVAVFVGGTSGIGEYTVKAFAKYVSKPTAYIVGRSQEAADRILAECKKLNPEGKFDFIKADVSLMKGVDEVCRQIQAKEAAINLLFESQGSMAFTKTTSEGLPVSAGLVLHSRLRFILNLLPLLQKAKTLRRVVSVLAASCEGPIDLNNIYSLGFDLHKQRDQMASLQTLLLEETARRAPDVTFIHDVPGVVKGGIMRDIEMTSRLRILIGISKLLAPLINTSPEEAGERHLYFATSSRYAPRENKTGVTGVPLHGDSTIARGSDGKTGSGMYSIDNKGESSSPTVESTLAGFRQDGTADKVWERITGDMTKIMGTTNL